MLKEIIPHLNEDELLKRRERIVAFVETFTRTHDINTMTSEEIDLWIEKLRPLRTEMRAIDAVLKKPIKPDQE